MFGYKCNLCGRDEDRWFATLVERDKHEANGDKPCKPGASLVNKKCRGTLHRQLSAPNFAVKGFNAGNGYSNKGVV